MVDFTTRNSYTEITLLVLDRDRAILKVIHNQQPPGGFNGMKHKASILFVVMVVLILAACSSSSAQGPNASLATVTPTSAPAVLPTASSMVPLEERLLAKIDINYPDELVFVKDFIWIKTDDGYVVQVDPTTNKVVNEIKVDTTTDPGHYCQGLGTDGESIWSCSASGDENHKTIDVVRIEPQTQKVVETVKVNKIFDQFDMPFLNNQIWVLSGSGDKLTGIDVTTNQAGLPIDLGTRCFQLAVMERMLVATCTLDNLILQIDPEKKEVVRRVTLASPRVVATTRSAVWVAQDDSVVRLDPKSLNPMVVFINLPGVGTSGDIFVTDEAVWVRQDNGFLYRINPTRDQISEQLKLDEPLSGGSVLATSDSVWTTASDDNLLIRLALK
jgi:outer membrane protein assembly factor BamB